LHVTLVEHHARTGVGVEAAVARVALQLDVGEQRAHGGVGHRVEVDLAAGVVADVVDGLGRVGGDFTHRVVTGPLELPLVADVAHGDLGVHVAADLEAGVGAGDDEAGDVADLADLDVFGRGRAFLRRKIGGLRAGDDHQGGGRTEQQALHKSHIFDLQ
jgi:hypothetical protein